MQIRSFLRDHELQQVVKSHRAPRQILYRTFRKWEYNCNLLFSLQNMRWARIILGFLIHRIRSLISGKKGHVLEEGSRAPDFSLPDETGAMHTLKDYAGKKVLLWFYLRSRTPG